MSFMRQSGPTRFGAGVIVAAVALAIAGCGPRQTVPASQILGRLSPGHPRLILTAERLALLKRDLPDDPWLRSRYRNRKARADALLAEPPSVFRLKGTDFLLATSRQVLERVSTLALVCRVEGDHRYRDRCWAELEAAARFPDWEPQHFLDTAEMTTAFAIGYDWLYDEWTVGQRRTLREAIEKLGLEPGLKWDLNPFRPRLWWMRRSNNWNIVCNGGLGLGALAIGDESPDIAGKVLARCIASAPICLKEFGPDGAWPEGPMYWGLTTLYESMFLDALSTACGTEFGLGDMPGESQGGWFPLYLNGPAQGAFNFGDADEEKAPRTGPQLLWMARRFQEPRYAQYEVENAHGRMGALDLVWAPGLARAPWQTIPTDRYFRGVEVATMRDKWSDPKAWFVGFKAGSNAVAHSHLDVGSFVLEAKGERWAIDLGPDDYDLPGYFDGGRFGSSGRRWSYYRLRAEGHNTLVINPGNAPDQNPSGKGRITSFVSTAPEADVTADLTGAYPAAVRVTRSISLLRGKGMDLVDSVKLARRGDLWWFLQTRANIKPAADGRTLTLAQDGQTMSVALLTPAEGRFQCGPAEPLPTSPNPPNQASNRGVTRIALHLAGVEETTITVQFR